MRLLITILALSLCSVLADAQDSKKAKSFSINNFQVDAGRLEMNFKDKNSYKAIRDGVDILVFGATEAENFRIKAETILFEYASKEDTQPKFMKLSGEVEIERAGLVLHCERGSINLESQVSHFYVISLIEVSEGDVTMSAEKVGEVKVNFDNGDFTLVDGKGLQIKTEEEAPEE